jgi:hypothetical protein
VLTTARCASKDVLSAGLFEEMLRAEVTQLEELARSIENRRIRPAIGRIGDNTPPAELHELRARIAELHGLRAALWRRFFRPSRPDDSGNAVKG